MVEILKIIVWPATVIIAIFLLRKALVELIPNLKKLKYKNLELEFEKDAINLLASIERDVPYTEPPYTEPPEEESLELPETLEPKEDIQTFFQVRQRTPSEIILSVWAEIENEIKSLSKRNNIKVQTFDSVRTISDRLLKKGIIDIGISNALLELNMYRNKVAHAQNEYITKDISNTFFEGANRLLLYLKAI